MKKIFAIALALVMVFSMASAFAASECYVWGTDWPCDVDDTTPWCGKGKVEIVPLVKVNTACGWEYQVNTCAGAVRSEAIFFAVKLTVDAYPDADWWNEASLTLKFWDDSEAEIGLPLADETVAGALNMKSKKEVVYYFADDFGWIDLANDDDDYVADADQDGDDKLTFKDVALFAPIDDEAPACGETYADYEICATLASFYDGASVDAYNKLGDYYYSIPGYPAFDDMDEVEDYSKGINGYIYIWTQDDDLAIDMDNADNKAAFYVKDGAISLANWNYDLDDNDEFYLQVMEDFGFAACGTAPCITHLNVLKNFGWNDAFESCTGWSDKAAAIVDAECVVAIPKTGDASLLAWLF